MSKFRKYALELDDAAKAAFKRYNDAVKVLGWAERSKDETPMRNGADPAYAAKAAQAEAVYHSSRDDVRKAQQGILAAADGLKNVRATLSDELDAFFAAAVEDVAPVTLELLRSGILRPDEYLRLYNEAANSENPTMCRLIGKYAADAADRIGAGADAAQLRGIADRANKLNGCEWLDAFDYLTDCLRRCGNNPAMIPRWDELTANVINEF